MDRETASLLMHVHIPNDIEDLDTLEQRAVREGAGGGGAKNLL